MPDWITLPRLFLVAAPAAMLLSASALAAGERRAKARRARDALGRPAARIEEGAAGERILLEGRLDVIEGPCARFEDGAPAAAATVEAFGAGAVPGGLRVRFEEGKEPFIARSTRAAHLVLTVGQERVALTGPVDVYVGSHEMDPAAPFGRLAPEVRERIALVAGAEALPGPGARGPILERPVFRSLRDGARVRAAGVLVKRSEGDRTGYRDRARWSLAGDEDAPLVLAYEGTPRYGGAITAIARGVRRVQRMHAALLASLVLGALALLAAIQNRSTHRSDPRTEGAASTPDRAHGLPGSSHHEPRIDPTLCASLKKDHEAAVAKLAPCTSDAQCAADARGGAVYELEGCYRFRNRSFPLNEAEAIQKRWTSHGCATSYEICPPPPLAMCSEGRCVERPPPPIPETWRRHDLPGVLSLYLPPEVKPASVPSIDSGTQVFRGGGIEMTTDLDARSSGDPDLPGKLITTAIGGHAAKLWKRSREITVLFEGQPGCAPPRCPFFAQEYDLTLRARCDTEAACDDAWRALESVRLW